MKWRYFLLFFLILPGLLGCPTRRLVPDPVPPEPKVKEVALSWRQLELLGGMAPPVGSRPYFVEMIAYNEKPIEKKLP